MTAGGLQFGLHSPLSMRVRQGRDQVLQRRWERRRTKPHPRTNSWKACWGQPLTSSNLVSSAGQRARTVRRCGPSAFLVSDLVSVGILGREHGCERCLLVHVLAPDQATDHAAHAAYSVTRFGQRTEGFRNVVPKPLCVSRPGQIKKQQPDGCGVPPHLMQGRGPGIRAEQTP